MNTNELLRDVERTATAEAQSRKAEQAACVESVKAELRPEVEQAEARLKPAEREAQQILRELDEIIRAVAPAGAFGPPELAEYTGRIRSTLLGGETASIFDQARVGIEQFHALTFAQLDPATGGLHPDDKRAVCLARVRDNLRPLLQTGISGAWRQLARLRTHVETWHASRQPGAPSRPPVMTAEPRPARPAEPPVETEFTP